MVFVTSEVQPTFDPRLFMGPCLIRASDPAFFVRSEPSFLLNLCRFD